MRMIPNSAAPHNAFFGKKRTRFRKTRESCPCARRMPNRLPHLRIGVFLPSKNFPHLILIFGYQHKTTTFRRFLITEIGDRPHRMGVCPQNSHLRLLGLTRAASLGKGSVAGSGASRVQRTPLAPSTSSQRKGRKARDSKIRSDLNLEFR